jgi:hypothetical protein
VLSFFPEKSYPDLAETLPWVHNCYHKGVDDGLWQNAEQFLSYVDDAYRGDGLAARQFLATRIHSSAPMVAPPISSTDEPDVKARKQHLRDLMSEMPDSFDRTAKRALAAECERFVMKGNYQSEPWLPYREWVTSLVPDRDTVISFNYDRVAETAAEAAKVLDKLWIGRPGDEPPKNRVPLLKLHGSVDWTLQKSPDDSSQVVLSKTALPAQQILTDPSIDIGIAAPGGSKSRFVASHFEGLWQLAEHALHEADILMVVGYSFPDTDPAAHHRLVGAFSDGEAPNRAVHIVLGVDATIASSRLRAFVRSTAGNRFVGVSDHFMWRRRSHVPTLWIVQHPLGTQDFIGRHEQFTRPVLPL